MHASCSGWRDDPFVVQCNVEVLCVVNLLEVQVL